MNLGTRTGECLNNILCCDWRSPPGLSSSHHNHQLELIDETSPEKGVDNTEKFEATSHKKM